MYGENPPAEEVEKIPARRFGRPRELGDVVCFLCSEQASYVNGSIISVDGVLYLVADVSDNANSALIVVDVQRGVDDAAYWGARATTRRARPTSRH